jgi:hypothetical protein
MIFSLAADITPEYLEESEDPFANIEVIENVFTNEQKKEMLKKLQRL